MNYRKQLIKILVFFIVLSCSSEEVKPKLPYYQSADFTPHFYTSFLEASGKYHHRIKDFQLTDHSGSSFSSEKLKGSIYVVNFMFTSCGSICPQMTNHLKTVAQLPEFRQLYFLSFSVMPEVDVPSQLEKYRQKNGITNDRWLFLTGDKEVIYDLARNAYWIERNQIEATVNANELVHSEHMVLVDKQGRIRGIYNGSLKLEMNFLRDDLKTLMNE